MPDNTQDKLYAITVGDDYFHVNIWGDASSEVVEESTKELLAKRDASQPRVNKLLCDIRGLKPHKLDIVGQSRGIGTLWDIRSFDKVAFLVNESPVTDLLQQALSVVHFTGKIRTFEDEAEAIAWLKT